MADKIVHKKDIKLFLGATQQVTEPVTIFGFEAYRLDMSTGRANRILIPNVPVVFRPKEDMIEDGRLVAWVSNTPANLRVLKELVDADVVILADDSVLEDINEIAPAAPVSFSDADYAALCEKTKAELFTIASDAGLNPKGNWSAKMLADKIAGRTSKK